MGDSSDDDQMSVEVCTSPSFHGQTCTDLECRQVMFDPSNPYRRKSSLVTTETTKPHLLQRHPSKTQCLVHQFLESQQPARGARPGGTHDDHGHHPRGYGMDVSSERGLNRVVEPKGAVAVAGAAPSRYEIVDNPSDTSDVGQVDQKHWKLGIVKPSLDMDKAGSEALRSRLLTKKQLSDMAWGVRELSRRLGSMRLKSRVQNIFVLAKIYDRDLIPKVRELTKWLLGREREGRYTVYVQEEIREDNMFDKAGLMVELRKEYVEAGEEPDKEISSRLRCWDEHMCRARPHTFDFVITLGGDGTVLYASWLFQRIVPPVLSFSLGSLGFLTKFDFEDFRKTLAGAFKDGVTVSLRLRFEATIMRSQKRTRLVTDSAGGGGAVDGENLDAKWDLVEELVGEERDDEHTHRPDGTYEILNEVVVDRGPNPSKILAAPLEFSTCLAANADAILFSFLSKPCHSPRSSATTSTSHQCWQTASASRRRRARRPTTWRRAARCATRRTR